LYFDLAGGNRIPKIGERKARSVAELRAAGVGVNHVLLVHYGTAASSDLFAAALTMLDPLVALSVVSVPLAADLPANNDLMQQDLQRAEQLSRDVEVCALSDGDPNQQIVALAKELDCDLLIMGEIEESITESPLVVDCKTIVRNSPCAVCLVTLPAIPHETEE
jgi:nucleotide-binding universal stress UspA family protein